MCVDCSKVHQVRVLSCQGGSKDKEESVCRSAITLFLSLFSFVSLSPCLGLGGKEVNVTSSASPPPLLAETEQLNQ